jgi:RNase P subunit RPR2
MSEEQRMFCEHCNRIVSVGKNNHINSPDTKRRHVVTYCNECQRALFIYVKGIPTLVEHIKD